MSVSLNGTFAFYQLLSKFQAWEGITWGHLWLDETTFTVVRGSQEPTCICCFAQLYGLRNTTVRIQMVLPGDSLHPGQRLPSLTLVVTSMHPHTLGGTTAVGRPERAPTRRSPSRLLASCQVAPCNRWRPLRGRPAGLWGHDHARGCGFFLPPLTSPCSDACSV